MKSKSTAISVAIIIATLFVAAAIFFSGSIVRNPQSEGELAIDTVVGNITESAIRPVDENDHIRGNPSAQIFLVEYSDFDCPFCQQFHITMRRIIDEYGLDGRVAWVYRHFPIQELHPNASRLAEASECVNELGGNGPFWQFADLIFDERATGEFTDISRLSEFAETTGVDVTAFESCLSSGRYKERVDSDLEEVIAAGGRGTPYTFILLGGQSSVIDGAQSYDFMKGIIDTLLRGMDGIRDPAN